MKVRVTGWMKIGDEQLIRIVIYTFFKRNVVDLFSVEDEFRWILVVESVL